MIHLSLLHLFKRKKIYILVLFSRTLFTWHIVNYYFFSHYSKSTQPHEYFCFSFLLLFFLICHCPPLLLFFFSPRRVCFFFYFLLAPFFAPFFFYSSFGSWVDGASRDFVSFRVVPGDQECMCACVCVGWSSRIQVVGRETRGKRGFYRQFLVVTFTGG